MLRYASGGLARITILIAVLLLTMPPTAMAAGFEPVILAVTINQEQMGDLFFLFGKDGKLLITPDQLKGLGINPPDSWQTRRIDGNLYYSMADMAPQVKYLLDEKHGSLALTADPNLFEIQHLDLSSQQQDITSLRPEETSVIFNYQLTGNFGDDHSFENFTAPLQLSLGQGPLYGLTSFIYHRPSGESGDWVRRGTTLFYDVPHDLSRFVFGDFNAANGLLGGGAGFGGISYGKSFGMAPYYKISPLPQYLGVLNTPSQVDLYINGNKVKSESLRPGEFVLGNIPNTSGYGEITVVTRDAFGNEIESTQSFYVGSDLLKPGLHDFSYNLGFQRREAEDELFKYRDLSFIGYHRLGLTPWLTCGIRGEADRELWNVALTAQSLLYDFGELELVAATSEANRRNDGAVALSYQFNWKLFNIRAFSKYLGRDYANLSLAPESDRMRKEINLSSGLSLRDYGSFSIYYDYRDNYDQDDTRTTRISYSIRLSDNLGLNISASREKTFSPGDGDSPVKREIFAGLSWLLGGNVSARYDYHHKDDGSEQTLSLQKNPPVGNGYGYNLRVGHRENNETENNFNGRLSFRAPYGVYDLWYNHTGGQDNYELSTAGAVSLVEGGLYATKPVYDSLVVVKVGDLPGVGVDINNQQYGLTGEDGTLAVSGLGAYRDNLISIEDRDVPVNYRLDEVQKYISPYPHSVAMFKFPAVRLQGFEGKLFLKGKGERKPAEYGRLTLEPGDRKIESVVGRGGEFYLENLAPGKIPANIWLEGKSCDLTLEIPQSNELIVDLGELDCVIP